MNNINTKPPLFTRLANWLNESPVAKVVVSAAAIMTFILLLTNSGWTYWKEYRALKQMPTIRIVSFTSYSITAPVAVEQVLGAFAGSKKEGPRIPIPHFPIILEFANPTNQKTSLSHCLLRLKFYQRQGAHESDGYMTTQALKNSSFEANPVLSVESGETKQAELLFFFFPTPEFELLLNDKTTQPQQFQVTCHNEAGAPIESRI